MAAKALSEILKIWEGEVWAKEIDEAETKMLVEGARWAREIDMEENQDTIKRSACGIGKSGAE